MGDGRKKAIEKFIKLRKQLREETDPEKREKIWYQMRAVQMHSINAMYGVRGLYDEDSDTIIPLSFDSIGEKNNRKYDIPDEVLLESFKERKKYKRVIDIDNPNLEEIVNDVNSIKVVKPVMYALFKEMVLHIIQGNEDVKPYRESIIEHASPDRDAIVNRFKNMKENNISYIVYDIKRSLSVLTNKPMESFDLELIGDDETSLYYLVKSEDKDVLGSVVLNIRPVVEADIEHKPKPESVIEKVNKKKIGKLVEWVDYNHTYMSWNGLQRYLADHNIPHTKYSLCDEDDGEYGEEIKLCTADISKETLLKMWEDMKLIGDPTDLDYVIFYMED